MSCLRRWSMTETCVRYRRPRRWSSLRRASSGAVSFCGCRCMRASAAADDAAELLVLFGGFEGFEFVRVDEFAIFVVDLGPISSWRRST